MTPQLKEEIKQTKPFLSLEQEALLSIERTAAVLRHELAELLKAHGVTPTQYNVLRILRGAGDKGLCRNDVRDRLVSEVPDVSRILDRMEDMGLITRERDQADRRFVTTRITPKGLALLDRLDAPVAESDRQQLSRLTESELRALIRLLAKARQRP